MRPYTFYITSSYSPVRLYLYIMCLCAENSVIFAYMCVCVCERIIYCTEIHDESFIVPRSAAPAPGASTCLCGGPKLAQAVANAWCGVAKVLWRAVISGTDRPYPVLGAGAFEYIRSNARARVLSFALRPQQPPPQRPAISFSIYKLFN